MSWSTLVGEALDASGAVGAAEGLRVRPGELLARADGHEVSLIRDVWPRTAWVRTCAALASQPVFRGRILSGELPEEADRVFTLLGLDLVPAGWDRLVATCSCDHWRGRCAHLTTVAAALGEEADRDPFVLVRWAGLDKRALVALVRDPSTGERELPDPKNGAGENTAYSPEEGSADVFVAPAGTSERISPETFWDPVPIPSVPPLPSGTGARVRAVAPGHVADELPLFDGP
ncbi:hypothetical protein [Nocardiopsis sp. MG754419]|uniref:hypothetical protein n=1 Tax=Nocardiopsis sp. MG754419 TaxID=2259865 RepID=UPI001BAC3DE2|nr:hypothetical protein [Nocardiopsis sp. MG754419]MBR8744275.1 hypothetical protein [Nocardiopsis sp. MG754419]